MVIQIENTYCIVTAQLTYLFETLVIPYSEISHITKLCKVSAEIRGLEPNPSFGKADCPKAGEFLPTVFKKEHEVDTFKIYMKSGQSYSISLINFNGMYIAVDHLEEEAVKEVARRSNRIKDLYSKIFKYLTK